MEKELRICEDNLSYVERRFIESLPSIINQHGEWFNTGYDHQYKYWRKEWYGICTWLDHKHFGWVEPRRSYFERIYGFK